MSLAKLPSCYLFDVASGTQLEKLLRRGNNFQTFGVSVAIDAGVVAVGARTFCIGMDIRLQGFFCSMYLPATY